jgi:hypothetical protein
LHKESLKETEGITHRATAAVVRIAATEGFRFTARDLAEARGVKARQPPGAELREVSGQWMDACSNTAEHDCGSAYHYCTGQNWECVGYSYY